MSTFTIKRMDMCSYKFMGIGWRNILYLEYDMLNADLSVDTTPEDMWTNNRYVSAIESYIDANGIAMEHGLQSIPYMIKTIHKNTGEYYASMPSIPWQFYENGLSLLDEYEIMITSTEEARTRSTQHERDMKFLLEYDEDLTDADGNPRGSDDQRNWGPDVPLGADRVPPFVHHNWYPDSGTLEENKPVIFYGGNWDKYDNKNVRWPYFYPILCIQGTKANPISITLVGWTFDKPYYLKGIANNIEPGYNVSNHCLYNLDWWQVNSERQYILEHWLKNLDADSSKDFLENKLFIRFGQWAEDMDPFDGWGDPDDEDNPSGGDGDGMLDGDEIPVDVPNVAAFNGFFTAYKCTAGQMASFASFCWSTDFDATLKKFYTSPSQAILGVMFVPYSPVASTSQNIYLGNIDSGVGASKITRQFQIKDCGAIYLPEATKSYLDYNPFTKISIYLPMVGIRELSADDCVGKTIGVKYALDILSGGCVAHVTVNGTIMYSFAGNCAIQVPVTSENLGQAALAAATSAAGMGVAVASGGAAAPAAGAMSVASYGMTNAAGAISSGSGLASAMKSGVSHGGSLSSAGGWCGPGKPHLIISYPNIAKCHNQKDWQGYPTFRGNLVGGFSGYTQFEAVKLKATKATMEEQQEILELLKGGVFL